MKEGCATIYYVCKKCKKTRFHEMIFSKDLCNFNEQTFAEELKSCKIKLICLDKTEEFEGIYVTEAIKMYKNYFDVDLKKVSDFIEKGVEVIKNL